LEQDNEFDESIANILNNIEIYRELVYLKIVDNCLNIRRTAA